MSTYAIIAALLYFAAYVPLAFLSGKYRDVPALSACAVIFCMCAVWTVRGFWARIKLTSPVVLSGLCTAGIIGSTIAALAFKGNSVFKTALITRGAVILLAPVSDVLSGNRISPRSIIASVLSIYAIILMHIHKINGSSADMPLELALILLLYTVCYAIKLPLFSGPKRTRDDSFLISEQTVAVAVYSVVTFINHGFPHDIVLAPIAIGVCSQLTGIFGGAVLISPAEHSATVPLNRAASMTAGLIGSALLGQQITAGQTAGFVLLLLAVAILVKPHRTAVRVIQDKLR